MVSWKEELAVLLQRSTFNTVDEGIGQMYPSKDKEFNIGAGYCQHAQLPWKLVTSLTYS